MLFTRGFMSGKKDRLRIDLRVWTRMFVLIQALVVSTHYKPSLNVVFAFL